MRYTVAVLAIALYIPGVTEGQSPAVAPGARIRVTAPDRSLERHVTTILEVRGDSIVVGGPGGSQTLGLAAVTALDVSTGTRRQAAKGAGLGFAIGAVTGAVIGALTYEECNPQGFLDCLYASESRGEDAMFGGVALGGLGLVIGVVAGALNRTDKWTSVDLPVRFAATSTPTGGIGVVLTRSF